jgi:hypothetical protein
MKHGIFLIALLANGVALFMIFNPWYEDWSAQGVVFLVVEAVFLLFVGVPILIHHLRKGLSFRDALAATLQTAMDFLAGWV